MLMSLFTGFLAHVNRSGNGSVESVVLLAVMLLHLLLPLCCAEA